MDFHLDFHLLPVLAQATSTNLKVVLSSAILVPSLLAIARGIYHLFLSPLRSVPGPWYAAISEIWILVQTFRCRKVRAIDDLFKKYGKVVRIAPNTVAFLDPQTSRVVYNGLKLDKGPLYDAVHMNGHLHSVSIIEHSVHAKYRRIYSSHYTPGNIALLHPDMKASAQVLVEKILEAKDRQPLDIFPGIHLVMIDLILKSTFGTHPGALDEWSENSHNIFLSSIEDYGRLILLAGITPGWLMSIISRFPNKRWQVFCQSGEILFNSLADLVREMQTEKNAGRLEEREKPTLIQRMFAHNDSCAPEDVLSFEDMVSESMSHLLAGVDASAVVTSYILWRFAGLPQDIKEKIHAELDVAMPDPMVIPDLKILQSLPLLDGLIKEGESLLAFSRSPKAMAAKADVGTGFVGLRIHGPIPTFLERRSPPGEPLDILGYKVPPKTVIGTQSWSMHRQDAVYPDPEKFDVFRWVDANQPQDAMSQSLVPFSMGPRMCIGQHLARNSIRTMMAAIIRNFEVLPCPETNDTTMEMMELFGMFPIGLSCKLNFRSRA